MLKDVLSTLCYIYKQKPNKYASVAILCNQQLTEDIIKDLNVMCRLDDIDLHIEYIKFDTDYKFECGVILYIENDQLGISVEEAYYNGKYKTFSDDYIYIDKECCDKIILNQTAYEGDMDIFCIDWKL